MKWAIIHLAVAIQEAEDRLAQCKANLDPKYNILLTEPTRDEEDYVLYWKKYRVYGADQVDVRLARTPCVMRQVTHVHAKVDWSGKQPYLDVFENRPVWVNDPEEVDLLLRGLVKVATAMKVDKIVEPLWWPGGERPTNFDRVRSLYEKAGFTVHLPNGTSRVGRAEWRAVTEDAQWVPASAPDPETLTHS